MGRSVMLGNGSLTVGLNEHGLVHDFYYPYVGLDNLSTSRSMHHMLGVWVDGRFSWVDDGSWEVTADFEEDALISSVTMRNPDMQVELFSSDFVDSEMNVFYRRILVRNLADHYQNIRVFFHQVFQISRGGRGDTALFVPEENYVLDYKGRCSLIIYGQEHDGTPFDQFSVGNFGIEGKEGTYRDAEDGELSGNPVEHGGVDSTMRFSCSLSAGDQTMLQYWIVAADSQYNAQKLHDQIKSEGLERRLDVTRQYWRHWLHIADHKLARVEDKYIPMIKKSLMVIKVHADKRGGIIASCDSSIYNYGRDYYSYVWPRDGAYAVWPLIRLGYKEEAKKFFSFCRDILMTEGYLMHKYQPDKSIGSTWHPLLHGKHRELAIQEDETAIILYMLSEYYELSKDHDFVFNLYTTLIQPAANFVADFIDQETGLPHASYDLWEEKFLTHTYTVAVVYQALLASADFADEFGYPDDAVKWRRSATSILENADIFFHPEQQYYRKGFLLNENGSLEFDDVLDVSSFYGVFMFADDFGKDKLASTMRVIEERLLDKCPAGGCPRYESDRYFESAPSYSGNPWFITTLWIAQYYIRQGETKKAENYIRWAMQHTLPSGMISEQINPSTGLPLSVAPLVWSHAEFINTVLDLSKVE